MLSNILPVDDDNPVAKLCDSKIESVGEFPISLFVVAGIDISSEAIQEVIKIAIRMYIVA